MKSILVLLYCFFILALSVSQSRAHSRDCAALLAHTPATRPIQPVGPRPQHVFIIVLENKSFDDTFGPHSAAPYLNCLAEQRGKLLSQYYGIGHWSLDNYIAMISGQAPNAITQAEESAQLSYRRL